MTLTTTITPVDAPPTLVAKLDDRTVAMKVRSLRIDVSIVGLSSETTMEITFENPHDRDLEGEILFPLPEGAALTGYGLDVAGVVVDASLVGKRRAREIFEEEVRKGIDPGLLEHAGGNRFRTRVWPVPSKGRRTVKVTYSAPLSGVGDSAVYELPLRFAAPKRDVSAGQEAGFPSWARFFQRPPREAREGGAFRLRVTVAKSGVHPEIAGDLGFEDRGDSFVAEASRPDRLPDRVRVTLPSVPARYSVVGFEEDGGCFFRIEDLVEIPPPGEGTVASPEKVGIVWDASLSRATEDKTRDFEVLRRLLGRWGTLEVRLLVLRDIVEDGGNYRILAGECEELLETLRDLPYDGGTAALPPLGGECDLHLLFSDGLTTFGAAAPPAADRPVYSLCSASTANHSLLRHLAEGSGGAHLDLGRRTTEEVVEAVGAEAYSYLGAEFSSGEVTEVFPSHPCPVTAGRLGVSGRLISEEAEIVLLYGRGGRVTERRTYRLRREGASSTGLAGRLWAQRKVDELSVFPDRYAEALLELGRRFSLVTPNSSLLVLETTEQHLEHDVEPAPSRRNLHEEWRRRLTEGERNEERRREEKLEQVHAWWVKRVEWWEKEYEYEPEPPDPPESDAGPTAMRMASPRSPPGAEEQAYVGGGSDTGADMDYCLSEFADLDAGAGAVPAAASLDAPAPPPGDEAGAPSGGIAVQAWDPEAPYLNAMKEAGAEGAYEAYLREREDRSRSPSFFLDCASELYRIGKADLGRRVLLNVAELELMSPPLLRICAYKLATEGETRAAAEILEQVLRMRPDEPQSHRDLALVLEETGERERAAELLWKVVTGGWDDRFPEIETIALVELNRLLERARREGLPVDTKALGIEDRFLKLLDVDLRVTLAWDADLTDVDLWVIEPTGEKCFYSNQLTAIGGRNSLDFTQGYGPEEYLLRRAVPGTYAIQANYYGSSQQNLVGPVTILATIFRNYGRADEERRVVTVRVEEVREVLDVAKVGIPS